MALKEVKQMGQVEIRESIEKIRLWFDQNEQMQPELVRRAYMRLLDLLREGAARSMVISRARCSEHLEVYERFVYRLDRIENPAKPIPQENDISPEDIYNRLRNVVRICLKERPVF